MVRTDPLTREVVGGLAGVGASQRAYLGYLALQALAVALWWPKGDVADALRDGGGPAPLVAALIACGLATAYHAIRSGAEEILLPGQHTLREWLHATDLAPGAIVRGYLAGSGLQSLHAVALSSPLLLAALTVSGGTWAALGWSIVAIVLHATCYRLAAASVYLAIGHRGDLAFWSVRGLLVGGLAASAIWTPLASLPRVLAGLASGDLATPAVLVLSHLAAAAALGRLLAGQLGRERG